MELYYNLLEDRAIIKVSGEDRINFLQTLLSNDINKVSATQSIYSLMLTPQGKYLFDFFISQEADHFLIEASKKRVTELINKLLLYKLRSQIQIEDLTDNYKILSLTGSGLVKLFAAPLTPGLTAKTDNYIIYVDPRTITMGARLIVKQFNQLDLKHDETCYDELRIRNQIPEGDKDLLPEKSFPLEYGLDAFNAIDFNKGCYIGQEVTSRTKYRGTIRKKIVQVSGTPPLPPAGTEILVGEEKIGIMCSSFNDQGLALIRTEEYEKNKGTAQADGCKLNIKD